MAVEDNDQAAQFALTGNGGVRGDSGRECYIHRLMYINF
jgi:hypothetical protein